MSDTEPIGEKFCFVSINSGLTFVDRQAHYPYKIVISMSRDGALLMMEQIISQLKDNDEDVQIEQFGKVFFIDDDG